MKNTITIVLTMLAIAWLAAPVGATDFTFTAAAQGGSSGVWGLDGNWEDPNGDPGTPMAGDTATIPNGETCRVEVQNQQVDSIDVQSGGTLRVIAQETDSRSLIISDDSTINGTLSLESSAQAVGGLTLGGTTAITLHGTGTIRGVAPPAFYAGIFYFSFCTLESCTLTIPDLTITGNIFVHTNLVFDGTMRVDASPDDLQLGFFGCWFGASNGRLPHTGRPPTGAPIHFKFEPQAPATSTEEPHRNSIRGRQLPSDRRRGALTHSGERLVLPSCSPGDVIRVGWWL